MNIGILSSHTGTTAAAVIEACALNRIAGRVSIVIANNSQAEVLQRARDADCAAYHLSRKTHPDQDELDLAITARLQEHEVDLVLLAGFLRKVGAPTLRAFSGRILNVHPSLLPRYGGQGMYGSAVHQAVITSGDTVSGATVHLVSEEYDEGAIVTQVSVPVEPGDDAMTLELRVRAAERGLLVDTLGRLSRGELGLPSGWRRP